MRNGLKQVIPADATGPTAEDAARLKLSRLKQVWSSMISRCYNRDTGNFKNYGARGITVCERWRESFENFLEDMGPRPTESHTLERLDVNGNYCPENCQWATWEVQVRNKRSNVFLTHNGETRILLDWAKDCAAGPQAFVNRIRRGWGIAEALAYPKGKHKPRNTRDPDCRI